MVDNYQQACGHTPISIIEGMILFSYTDNQGILLGNGRVQVLAWGLFLLGLLPQLVCHSHRYWAYSSKSTVQPEMETCFQDGACSVCFLLHLRLLPHSSHLGRDRAECPVLCTRSPPAILHLVVSVCQSCSPSSPLPLLPPTVCSLLDLHVLSPDVYQVQKYLPLNLYPQIPNCLSRCSLSDSYSKKSLLPVAPTVPLT